MRAIFRTCGNESQPGLQLVEKLATLLRIVLLFATNLYTLQVFVGRFTLALDQIN